MKNREKKELTDFSENARKELEGKRRVAEKQWKYHSQEADSYRHHLEHLDAILGISQNRQDKGEKADSALTPTKFVKELLERSPDRWISIQEFLITGRTAAESGEVVTRGAEIESSIHGVLSRFRKKRLVLTKGNRDSRKYKLKP